MAAQYKYAQLNRRSSVLARVALRYPIDTSQIKLLKIVFLANHSINIKVNANNIKAEHIDLGSSAALQTVNLNNGEVTFNTVVGIANAAGQQNIIYLYFDSKYS